MQDSPAGGARRFAPAGRSFPRLEIKFALLVLLAALPFVVALGVTLLVPAAAAALRAYWPLPLVALAVAAAGIRLLRRDLHARVRELHAATNALAAGDTSYRVASARGAPGLPALASDLNRIVEQAEAQRCALAATSERFRQFVDLAADWYWQTGPDHRFSEIAGRNPGDRATLLGHCGWEIGRLKPRSMSWAAHRAVLARHQPFQELLLEIVEDVGESRFIECNGVPRFDAAGAFAGYHGTVSDVTRRIRAEDRARHYEALFQSLIEDAPEAIVVAEFHSGKLIEANLAAAQLFGRPRGQLIGASTIELCMVPGRSEELSRVTLTAIARRVLAGEKVVFEWSIRAADGREVAVESRWMRLPGPEKLMRAVLVDISLRQRVEAERERLRIESADRLQQLRQSEARFRQLTRLSSDWYWEQDADYRFVHTDVHSDAIDRPPLGESVGLARWERPGTRPIGITWEDHRRDLAARRPFAHLVLEVEPRGGLRSYVAVRGEPTFDAAGLFTGYRGVGSDISERYRADLMRAGERRVYEMLAADAPFEALMTTLCANIEQALVRPGIATLMMLEDGVLRLVAAPAAPPAFHTALAEGIRAGPNAGSCGSAAYFGELVISADIASDPRWDDYRELARDCELAANWSTPVRDSAGQVVAVFAVYGRQAAAPETVDLDLTAAAAALAAVLIERFRARAAQRESDARYKSLVELSQDAVLIHDERIIHYANPAAARMFKAHDAQAMIGIDLYERLLPASRDVALRRRRRVIELGRTVGHVELRLRCLDDSLIDVEAAAGPVEFDGRRMVQSSVRDISARKWAEREMHRLNEALEQKVAERTSELTAALHELEAFSYTVAHDLRAPLRAIDGFAQLLRLEGGFDAGGGALRDLDMIAASARRMSELIDGLLEFSGLGRGTVSFQRVATMAMVTAVVDEARSAFVHRPSVDIGYLPDLFGDPAMLRQVWVNLIFNAFKFSAQAAAPRIVIGCRIADGEIDFSVADNGAGFDPDYASKLFGIFQRLHARSEFEGTGVGLAIVKRVILRHHGRVWAEGAVGSGATFHFTLPETSGVVGLPDPQLSSAGAALAATSEP